MSSFHFAASVSYQGAAFHGWQSQLDPAVATVQEAVERAFSKVASAPIKVVCAGRTDAGVSAVGQVVSFDSPNDRPDKAWVLGANAHLPDSIRINWAVPVDATFHARFSATARRYKYVIYNERVASAILADGLTHVRIPLDANLMHDAAQALLGEQDFSSFRGAGCQSNSPNRNVHWVTVQRTGSLVVVDIKANAFLLHMVRNIVGSLIEVGLERRAPSWIADVLAVRDRREAGMTASPKGLYLVDVDYPGVFGLPNNPPLPLLF